ncbi:MAG: hypothetical protein V1913_01645 [Fibrobacterota bacterium]
MTKVAGFFILLLCGLAAADMDALGGQPASYLRMGIGNRAEAMGNAHTAFLAPTTVAAYWNPAMAVMTDSRFLMSGGYRFLSLGRRQGYVSLNGKIPPRLALCAALLYHGDNSIPIYDNDGFKTYDGYFMSLATHIGLAYKVRRRLALGFNTTIHNNSVVAGTGEKESISSWELGNLDLSAFYQVNTDLALGLNIKQIQGLIKWEVPTSGTELNTVITHHVPLEFKTGAAWSHLIKGRVFRAAADADLYLVPMETESLSFYQRFRQGEQTVEFHIGAEYFLYPEFPLRAGYSADGFSFGTGFYFLQGSLAHSKIDYAFTLEPNGSGTTHGLSWTTDW